MRDGSKTQRQSEIERAAYAVLEEKGYAAASMLAIARKAKASNETLYNWYGGKQGLFRTLVERNTAEIRAFLEEQASESRAPLETLAALGPKLLQLLTSPRAIALNKAAASDPTGELGEALGAAGRDTIAPLIGKVLEGARAKGLLAFEETGAATDLYISLLVGDLQIRLVTSAAMRPSEQTLAARATSALTGLTRLLAP
ncbi:TetR/AcrR family transcriptional regulator [Roseibium litorale]|uniref:TetR/AcrR family transcriptional regulator n=1 Tax=Roseibium litorale TaxID=2803841 RepID=A0ABR9CU86_9HYPH|nr:TetR/AcrR family transcriptional regulator [Roseibium litorale]MBD8894179.1 TetR/AcrR family transcriptional regulator [Roseibium litorale]